MAPIFRSSWACAGAASVLLACSPTLDWRELRAEGTDVQVLLPCKATVQSRTVPLAGTPVRWALHACSAGGQTWALAFADVADPARVGAALRELGATAAANINAARGGAQAVQVPGATPQADSGRQHLVGRLPDGQVVQEQIVVFAHGTRVFQATVVGSQLPDEAVEMFFGSLRVRP